MSAQRVNFRSWDEELAHRQNVIRKLEKMQGLESLLAEWEAQPQDSDEYRAYLLELRAKLRSVRNQYEAMRP
jgi:hypothetical protein